MSNPTVSFRISNYHLARGLRAIRHLEPDWKLENPSDMIRTIFNDYIAKSELFNNDPLTITPELLEEIAISRTSGRQENNQLTRLPQIKKLTASSNKTTQQIQRELEEEKLFNELRRESMEKQQQVVKPPPVETQLNEIDEQMELAMQTGKRILHKAPPELETDAIITTVTDFSPPKSWIEATEED